MVVEDKPIGSGRQVTVGDIKVDTDAINLNTDMLETQQINGSQKTQIVDGGGLPVGFATETTLALVEAKTNNLDTALSGIKSKTDNLDTALSGIKTGTDKIPTSPATEGGNLATIAGKDFATQTTLALIKTKTDNLDALLSTRATETTLGLVKGKLNTPQIDSSPTTYTYVGGLLTVVNEYIDGINYRTTLTYNADNTLATKSTVIV